MQKKPGTKPRPTTPAVLPLKEGEYALMVESEPAGATVVVNGTPCGKTPCRVVVRANGRGFLREQVSIKVRFIAANEGQSSQTVEDVLTTLDKVPSEIRFTTAGATRVVR
ncbi:MAG: PEGA domain-containing protein [Nibricoccus sp.]